MTDTIARTSAIDTATTTASTAAATIAETITHRRVTAGLLVAGAVGANAAFFGLGSSFGYPDVLQLPAEEILVRFDQTRLTTMAWFALLTLSAAVLGPAALLLRRLGTGRAAAWSARVGVAAAVAQVAGLSRWFLLVPDLADQALDPGPSPAHRAIAVAHFETAHTWLGTGLGETVGYALTAAWTVLLIVALRPRWRLVSGGGLVSAGLIGVGVLIPLGVPGTDLANFVGYVLWSLWLLAVAVMVTRPARAGRVRSVTGRA